MNEDPIRDAGRAARRKTRGAPGACCNWCGAADGKLQPFHLHTHHTAGRANDPLLAILLCPKCHAEAGELLATYGIDLSAECERTLPMVIVAVLVGIALTLIEWGKRLLYWAARLDEFTEALDANYPAWRTLPQAQA